MKTYGVVYLVTNRVNGKRYVGQTKASASQRWLQHCSDAKRYDTMLARAIRKHGADSFLVETVGTAETPDALDELERDLILRHRTLKPSGYNLTSGGNARHSVHEATRAKISAANMGRRPWNLGVPCSPETRAKIGASNTGRSHPARAPKSAATRALLSAAMTGRPSPRKGVPLTQEHRRRLSESAKGRRGTPHTEEFKLRMSLRLRGNRFGCAPKTEEHKAKIRASAIGRPRGKNGAWL